MNSKPLFSPLGAVFTIVIAIVAIVYFGGKSVALSATLLIAREQTKLIDGTPITVSRSFASPTDGSIAPAFTLTDTEGKDWSLTDLRGKKTLLLFWATWCPYCAQELPRIRSLPASAKGDFNVIGVTFKETPETVTAYRDKENIAFPLLLDPNAVVAEQYQIKATPWHVFIDENGRIMRTAPGVITEGELESLLHELEFVQ